MKLSFEPFGCMREQKTPSYMPNFYEYFMFPQLQLSELPKTFTTDYQTTFTLNFRQTPVPEITQKGNKMSLRNFHFSVSNFLSQPFCGKFTHHSSSLMSSSGFFFSSAFSLSTCGYCFSTKSNWRALPWRKNSDVASFTETIFEMNSAVE